MTRSVESSRCCPAAPRTTRSSSASPGRQDRDREGLAQRIVDGDVPESLKNRARSPSTSARWWPGPSTGASSRSASKAVLNEIKASEGRSHHLHRRDAHHRRRRRGRGLDGRLQHAQADAGPRRAAHDRRHDARRVPQVRREGPGARARFQPVLVEPPRWRRRSASSGAQGALRGAPRRAHHGRGPHRRSRAVRPIRHRHGTSRTRRSTSSTRRPRSCASRSTRCRTRSTTSNARAASSRSSARPSPRRRMPPRSSASQSSRRNWRTSARSWTPHGALAAREGRHRRDPRPKERIEDTRAEAERAERTGDLERRPSCAMPRCLP